MRDRDIDLIQGTLNVLILRALTWGAANGYAIAQWARDVTGGEIAIEEGALYPALHRMEQRGWVEAEWRLSPNNRRAKYYRLTTDGRRALKERVQSWQRLVTAVGTILTTTTKPV
jgi:PadR family transcriptional regulator PadR